jgi:hypothetical protein
MSGRVVVRTFGYRHEAELFRGILESHGIVSFVGADDEGSVHPGMGFTRGVNLFVSEEDAPQASDILNQHGEETEPGAEDEPA